MATNDILCHENGLRDKNSMWIVKSAFTKNISKYGLWFKIYYVKLYDIHKILNDIKVTRNNVYLINFWLFEISDLFLWLNSELITALKWLTARSNH